nr:MAG TPA: hypothetical protein [Herelleviridae sp.]
MVDGIKILVRRIFSTLPSGFFTSTSCTIRVPGGAGLMNRAFTQPWPTPPGLAVARMYTCVPGPLGLLRLMR